MPVCTPLRTTARALLSLPAAEPLHFQGQALSWHRSLITVETAQKKRRSCLHQFCSATADQAVSERPTSPDAAEDVVTVRVAQGQHEVEQAAVLRADAYYEAMPQPAREQARLHRQAQEQPYTRYVSSFKKQLATSFAQQIARDMRICRPGVAPQAACMVAVDTAADRVLATLDIRPPCCMTGQPVKGVPEGEDYAAYVVNVAVNAQTRGQGIGFQLLLGAAEFAAQHWQAQQMYTQVENWNEAAIGLYSKCGFKDVTEQLAPSMDGPTQLKLGQVRLLKAKLPLSCQI